MAKGLRRFISCSCGEKAEFTLYDEDYRVEMVLCKKCAEKYLETHEVETDVVFTE